MLTCSNEAGVRQTIDSQERETPLTKEPRWLTARAGRAKKLQHVLMVEGLPYPNFAQEVLARCRLGEHLDRDRVLAPGPAVHLTETPNADLRLEIDLELRDRLAREVVSFAYFLVLGR
jgi:hypothetical protein